MSSFKYYTGADDTTDLENRLSSVESLQLGQTSQINTLISTYVNKNIPNFLANVNMNQYYIGNISNPILGNQVASKTYVDNQDNSIISNLNNKLDLSGGTITGDLSISGNLTASGTNTLINANSIEIQDSMAKIARLNTDTDLVDIGQYGVYNSSGVKYTGIMRDASDGKYKIYHGLTEEPTTTVNVSGSGYTKSTLQIGALEATSATLTGSLNMSNYTVANVSTFQHATQMDYNIGSTFATTIMSINSANVDLGSSIRLRVGEIQQHPGVNYLLLSGPTVFAGYGLNGVLTNQTIASNGSISGVTSSHSVVSINTSNTNNILTRLIPSGTLLDYQKVKVVNRTASTSIDVIQRYTTSSGYFRCNHFLRLLPGATIDFVWDPTNSCWIQETIQPTFWENRYFQKAWRNDIDLNAFIQSNYTYIVKVNFMGGANTTINGVSGFDIVTATTDTPTNLTFNFSGAFGYTSATDGNYVDDTESIKLRGLCSPAGGDITVTGLTRDKYYLISWYCNNYDNTARMGYATDDISGARIQIVQNMWNNVGVGNITSFIFRADYTTRKFVLTNISGLYLYCITVRELS